MDEVELQIDEEELQIEVARWRCSRPEDCVMEIINRKRITLEMCGLVWSIQILPLQSASYSFNIVDVNPSETPLGSSEARALPSKLKPLLEEVYMSVKSAFKVEKSLDELYRFSRLYSRTVSGHKRWSIEADAEITAIGCKAAQEATIQAAKAAASFLCVLDTIEDSSKKSCVELETDLKRRPGWWIERWTVADELWATSFSEQEFHVTERIRFLAKAVEQGNVLQWCSVDEYEGLYPCFEVEIAVGELLEGDENVLGIGIANDRALRVRVGMTQNVEVICSQEGVETATSLGLRYLLPDLVKDHVKAALEATENGNNVVEGLLQRVVGYLAFLPRVCVVCGRDRLLSSTCGNICRARKQQYKAVLSIEKLKISEETMEKREKYVRKMYPDTSKGRSWLKIIVGTSFADNQRSEGKDEIDYEEAVGRVATMNSTDISAVLRPTGESIGIMEWGGDGEVDVDVDEISK